MTTETAEWLVDQMWELRKQLKTVRPFLAPMALSNFDMIDLQLERISHEAEICLEENKDEGYDDEKYDSNKENRKAI